MKWIKYNVHQSTINKGTEESPSYEDILLGKKVGYSEENLAIAEKEAYNGEYTIEEDDEVIEDEPLSVKYGGTGAKTPEQALVNLGASIAVTGSYVGTGTGGKDVPNSLTFGFRPKLFMITTETANNIWVSLYNLLPVMNTEKLTNEYTQLVGFNGDNNTYAKVEGNTLSWYALDASKQFNVNGREYLYFAIG